MSNSTEYASRATESAKVFEDIYKRHLWGNEGDAKFWSGDGSKAKHKRHYLPHFLEFIKTHNVRTILDLGCGDFQVGIDIYNGSRVDSYTGVDVVEELILRHRQDFSLPNLHFVTLDMLEDDLPDADLCIVRQVLQHHSLANVHKALKKLHKFPYTLITEDVNEDTTLKPNEDMRVGPGIRSGAGIIINRAPFNVPATILCEVPYTGMRRLRTYLVKREHWPK